MQGLKLKKQRSTGDLDRKGVTSIRSTGSTTSWMSSESGYTGGGASVISEGSNQSFILEVGKLGNLTDGDVNMKPCAPSISSKFKSS